MLMEDVFHCLVKQRQYCIPDSTQASTLSRPAVLRMGLVHWVSGTHGEEKQRSVLDESDIPVQPMAALEFESFLNLLQTLASPMFFPRRGPASAVSFHKGPDGKYLGFMGHIILKQILCTLNFIENL